MVQPLTRASEVERARKLIEHACKGYLIRRMHTVEDKLVFSGINHTDYVRMALTSFHDV